MYAIIETGGKQDKVQAGDVVFIEKLDVEPEQEITLDKCKVVGKGSPLLAALVDRGDFNQHDINLEITTQVDNILSREKVSDLILGCTHYPIVEENFHECYPQLHLINPALEQANAVKAYLTEQNALNPQEKGKFVICTSGDPQVYVNVGKRLGLFEASELKVVHI